MGEQPVRLVYEVAGVAEGEAAIERLTEAFQAHMAATGGAGEGTVEYERALANLRERVAEMREAQRAANVETINADRSFGDLAQRGITLATRFAGVANAAGSLLTRLGDGSGGRTAGLVGSVAANIAQFASLGQILGPGGALIGGLVGATSSIYNLIEAHNDGETAAREHAEALDAVATAARSARAAITEERNFAAGGLALAGMSTEDIVARRERALVELGESGTEDDRAAHRSLGRELSDEEEARLARLAATGNEAARARVEAERTRDAARELVATLDEELARRNEIAGLEGERPALSAPIPPTPTGRGGRRSRTRSVEEEPVDEGAFLERIGVEAEAVGIEREAAKMRERAEERAAFERAAADEAIKASEEREAAEEARHQHELDRIANERRARENLDRENMERLAEQTELLENVGDRIGGVFASAFASAIQGQEDFGQALAKGTKVALIQFGTTMVAEGIGAVLTGVGNTVINPPAAATKLAEGAGKIALGVGLGAAGAAIPTGGGGGATERAERPRVDQAPGGQGSATGPVVVNLNAPTVMGGTHAEVGRVLGVAIQAGAQRYGGGPGR